jgi:hypothetical protein
LSLLKQEDTLIVNSSSILSILNGNELDSNIPTQFKIISGVFLKENQWSLMYINTKDKIFYYINPCNQDDPNKKKIFANFL